MNRHPRAYDAWRDAVCSPKAAAAAETERETWERVAHAMLAHAEALEDELAGGEETKEALDNARQEIDRLNREIGELEDEVDGLERIVENRGEEDD